MILSLVRREVLLAHSEILRETPAVVQAREEVADHLGVHRGHVSPNDPLGRVLDESIYLDLFGNRNKRREINKDETHWKEVRSTNIDHYHPRRCHCTWCFGPVGQVLLPGFLTIDGLGGKPHCGLFLLVFPALVLLLRAWRVPPWTGIWAVKLWLMEITLIFRRD
jgi:hypothetical protein